MKKVYLLAAAIITGIALYSCDSHTYAEIAGDVPNPTYNANVKGIIDNQCVSCHNPTYDQTPYLETYAEVKDACENGSLLCRIDGSCGNIMPTSGKMPTVKISIINNWATQGFVEN